jgi:two-component system, NtrC family, response regulator HupR/HoxA
VTAAAKKRLLAVDDEPDMLDFLERVFRSEYEVLRAGSGEEALAVLDQSAVDIIVTDQKMPRITGVQLLERIRDRFPQLVKVLVSGYTDVPDIQRAVEQCHIHQYVVKPVDSERLREAVREATARQASGDWSFSLGKAR